jgi:hypothetical protein
MNQFAISYKYIDDIIKTQQEHNLTEQEIEALEIAQKALLLVELLGLSTQTEPQKAI